jgi:hypothetical protein
VIRNIDCFRQKKEKEFMKKIYCCLFVCTSFFGWLPNAQAQDSSKNSRADKSYFEAGLSYLNNNVYQGRHDSLRIPYLIPSIKYYHKSGFYAGASVSYLSSPQDRRVDLIALEAGYEFTKNKFSGLVSLDKDFYNSQSKNVRSETKGSANGTLGYDFGFIKPVVQGGVLFNSTDDYYAALGLEHSFFFADDNFEMTPSFLVNGSTQNYYSSYYVKRKFKTKKRNPPGVVTTAGTYLENASNFKIMDYELSLPLDYSIGKFIFDFTPTEAFPVNPNVVVTTVTPPSGVATTRTKTEELSNIFYWSAGITYTF